MSELSSVAEAHLRDDLGKGPEPEWRSETRRLFHDFIPEYLEIDTFERAAKQCASLDDYLELVPSQPILRNFATNVWEFAHGVDTLTSFPWNISIPVADVCNARCTFCTSWLDGRKFIDLEQLDMFEPVIKNAISISLGGHGEPMAHPRFDELCERLQMKLDPIAGLCTITNGYFLDKWRDLLQRINLVSMSVSLNAATAETHNEIMGLGQDAFPRIVEEIAYFIKAPKARTKHVFITMVVTQQNIAEIPAFIELGNTLGVTDVWLRSLLPQSELIGGLNYHLLPPYNHPDFERLRRLAIDAIATSRVPVQADPAMWSKPVFPARLAQSIRDRPPAIVPREQALRDRDLRRRNSYLYEQPKGMFRGQRVASEEFSDAKWKKGRLHLITPKSEGAYVASLDITYPVEPSRRRLKVTVDTDCTSGVLGLGLLDVEKNEWLQRVQVPAETNEIVSIETIATGQPIQLVIFNGGCDLAVARGSISEVRIEVDGIHQALPDDWSKLTLHNIHNSYDMLDDGSNPLGRVPRFACKAVYYNLYINEFFYRMNPCCYLQSVPGHEEVRFDGSIDFMEAWNSPAMVALRKRLRDGPLFGACMRCPEKW